MIKVEVKEEFTLRKFDELKNIVRKSKEEKGRLFVGDIFECDKDMAEYLTGNNPLNKTVVKVIEVIPEDIEVNEELVQAVATAIVGEAEEQGKEVHEIVKEIIEEATEPKKKTTKRKTTKKKEE